MAGGAETPHIVAPAAIARLAARMLATSQILTETCVAGFGIFATETMLGKVHVNYVRGSDRKITIDE